MWVDKELAQQRFDVCKGCERFFKTTATCLECGCFMKVKTKVASAACPLDKWVEV